MAGAVGFAPCDRRCHIRNVRLTTRDLTILKNYAVIVERDTGIKPTLSWVIRELWRLGCAEFEKKHTKHADLILGVEETMFENE